MFGAGCVRVLTAINYDNKGMALTGLIPRHKFPHPTGFRANYNPGVLINTGLTKTDKGRFDHFGDHFFTANLYMALFPGLSRDTGKCDRAI